MAEIIALDPPIDAVVEEENVGFDFGQVLDPAVAIVAIAAMNIYVIEGADPTPGMRILGSPLIVASPTTGVTMQCVIQRFGQMLDGVVYGLQCLVTTTDGQTLACDAQLRSRAPFS